MLAKKTTRNQIALPQHVLENLSGIDTFDLQIEADAIILRPVRPERAVEEWKRARARRIGQLSLRLPFHSHGTGKH